MIKQWLLVCQPHYRTQPYKNYVTNGPHLFLLFGSLWVELWHCFGLALAKKSGPDLASKHNLIWAIRQLFIWAKSMQKSIC